MKISILIIALFLFLFAGAGCILGPIGAAHLSPEQIDAMKKYNDGNLYICGIVEGGSRNGNVVFILLPKEAPLNVQFSADCHIK